MMFKFYKYSVCYVFLALLCSQSYGDSIAKNDATIAENSSSKRLADEQVQGADQKDIAKNGDNTLRSDQQIDIAADNVAADIVGNEEGRGVNKLPNELEKSELAEELKEEKVLEDIVNLNDDDRVEQDAKNDVPDVAMKSIDVEVEAKEVSGSEKTEIADIDNEVSVTVDATAPAYNKVLPIRGWNRYSCDSASTLKEWKRWWEYLRMKQPVVMSWIDGLILRIYPGNEICRALYVKGIYDPNLIVVVNSLLSRGGTFIDVGASIGYFSLLASKIVGKEGCVIAIEPSSRDYDRLIDNVRINKLENVISTYKFIISDKDQGTTPLMIACEERSSLNTIGKEFSTKGVDKVQTEEVDLMSIDTFVRKNGVIRIEVLKLDIEGSELKALRGARNVIEKFRPAIMLGINSTSLKACDTDRSEILKMLMELRYRAYKLVKFPRFALEPISDITKDRANVVFCLHESVVPPDLPQPTEKPISQKMKDFFVL